MEVTLNPSGALTYYYGISGRHCSPYTGLTLGSSVKFGRWIHVAIVRNFKTRKLTWYVNGIMKFQGPTKYDSAKASSLPLYIGKGATLVNYCGLIDEVGIWNRALGAAEISAVVSSAALAAPVVSRDAKLDSVRPFDGSVLLGTIENQGWSITTSYGKFKIPAARVVGFLSKAGARAATSQPASSDVRMVLVDAQVLAGRLAAPLVRLKLSDGQMLKIPIARTRQCGYRIGPEKPANSGEVRKVDEEFPATAVLSNGDHLAWDSSGMTIRFKSVCGTLDLRPEVVSTVAPTGSNTWRVNLKDSSSILGTLASAELKLKLKLGKNISVPSRNVAFLTFPGVIAKPTDVTTVLLRSGDRLVGKLGDKQLVVRTNYGSVDIPMGEIWKIKCQVNRMTELTTQRSTILRGKLKAESLVMVLGSGVRLSVPIDQITSIVFPRKLPAEVVRKIEALIKELGDTSAAKRKAAVTKLIAMGKDILVVLKRYTKNENAAISKGVKDVRDILEGKVKPRTTIQLDINGIDIPMPVTSAAGNRNGSIAV